LQRLTIILAASIIPALSALAATETDGVLVNPDADHIPLNKKIEILEDSGGRLSYDEVRRPPYAGQFVKSERSTLNYGNSRAAYWLRVTLENDAALPLERFLVNEFPLITRADLFLSDAAGRTETRRSGLTVPISHREVPDVLPIFSLKLAPHSRSQIYLRMQTEATMLVGLSLWEPTAFWRRNSSEMWIKGALIGALLILVGYNLLVAITLRDRTSYYAAAFLACFGVYLASLYALLYQYLWPDFPELAGHLPIAMSAVAIGAGLLFTRAYLMIPSAHPRLERLFQAALGLTICSILLIPVDHHLANTIAGIAGLTAVGLTSYSAWHSFRQGYKPARLYFIAWLPLWAGGAAFALVVLGVLEATALARLMLPFGFALGGLILSFALAERTTSALRKHRRELQTLVAERTRDLADTVAMLHAEIAERRKTETALRNSEQQFRFAYQTNPDAIAVNRLQDGVYVEVNDEFCRVTGYSRDEVIGRSTMELLVWDDEEKRRGFVKRLRRESAVRNFEAGFRLKNGSVRVGLISGTLFEQEGVPHMLTVTRDIMERKAQEEALKHSEEKLRSLVESSPMGILIVQGDPPRIVFANSPMYDLVQWSPEELSAMTEEDLATIFQPDDWGRFRSHYLRRLSEPTLPAHYEVPVIRKDGARRWVEIYVTSIQFAGQPSAQCCFIDITDRKRAEEERRLFLARAQESQRLESLGHMAGAIAHDFNNLLTGVLGNANLAIMDLPPGSPTMNTLRDIETAAKAAADLAQQMLICSGRGATMLKPLDLSQTIDSLHRLVAANIPPKVQAAYQLAPDLPPVNADATQIGQVLMNLVINAVEAIGSSEGRIEVRTERRRLDRATLDQAVMGQALPEADYVVLVVRDTGVGMDGETVRKVFDPFFSTKFLGRGMGLAAVQGVVRGHMGAIAVESRPGGGSCFSIYLPFAEPAASNVTAAVASGEAAQPMVLIVDDEPLVLRVAQRALERYGCRVLTAENGPDAVKLFSSDADRIDLVLLDYAIPGMTGEEIFDALNARRPGVKVLLTSGYQEERAMARMKGKGLAGFIQKPFHPQILAERVVGAMAKDNPA